MAAAIPFIMAAMAVMGQIQQANQQKNQAKAEENAHRYNEAVARNESQRSLNESTAQQLMVRRKQNAFLGNQRAAAAQTGTGFGGSTGDVLEESAILSELDALNVAYEGEIKSRGFMAEAELQDYYARVAKTKRPSTFQTILAAGQAGAQAFFGARAFGAGGGAGGASSLFGTNNSAGNFTTVRYG